MGPSGLFFVPFCLRLFVPLEIVMGHCSVEKTKSPLSNLSKVNDTKLI